MDERARHALHRRLEELLGPEATGTLMELLPPVGWADVATAHDVARGQAALADRLDTQIAGVRIEMAGLRTEMADLRTDVQTQMADVQTQMANLRVELVDLRRHVDTGLADVRVELADGFGHVHRELATVQRHLFLGMLGAMFTLTGVVWAIVTFAG